MRCDEREGWEVAHLLGVGPYALRRVQDSSAVSAGYGGVGGGDAKSRWKSIAPTDNDLRAYLDVEMEAGAGIH